LKSLDVVAYVRYASVYRDFRETSDFAKFLGDEGLHNDVLSDPTEIKQGLGEQDISPSDDA
jgi:transcriptional repressor NrdR